jgi:transglutaminase-like putative cysteine protease
LVAQMNRLALALGAFVLLLAPLPVRAQDEVVEENWYVVRIAGKPVGYGHEIVTRTTVDGRPAFLTRSEDKLAKSADGKVAIEESTSETWELEDGQFLRTSKVERDGGQETRLFAERVGNEIRVRRELNEGRRDTTVAIPEGTKVYDGIDGRLLLRFGLEVGRKLAITAFSEQSYGLATETAEVEGRRKVESLGETVDAFVVKVTSSEMPGAIATVLCDAEGALLRLDMGAFEMVRATRAEALATLETGGLGDSLTELPLEGAVAAWPTLDAAVVLATIAGSEGDEEPLFADDEYHAVSGPSRQYRLELRALAAPERAVERLPIAPRAPEMKRYCEPALLMQSDAPEIKAEAQRILSGDTDPLSAARKLCRDVFVRLKKEKPAASTASALETLRAGVGDCTEHAALFCALARAAGLPAREAQGVTLRGDGAGYHAWAEVLIDGRWVAVDPTVDAVGLPAAYIRLGTSDGNDADPAHGAAMLRLIGRTELAIVSATRRGTTFDPRDRTALARREGDLWRDLGSDFTADLSGGWKLQSAQPPNTVFLSPAGEAIVVTVSEVLLVSDEVWAEFERGVVSAMKTPLELESESEEGAQQVRIYRYTLDRQGGKLAGRMRVVSAGPIFYAVNAMMKADAAKPGDLEKMVARVTLGDAAR